MAQSLKKTTSGLVLSLVWSAAVPAAAERINHAGRILGPAVSVTNATLFNTNNADVILSAMQIFPVTSAWNENISRRPVLANSDAMIAQISADLLSSRRTLRAFYEMNFVLVPDTQPLMPIAFFYWPEESDPSPYPTPTNLPVETWPHETGTMTLSEWQQTDDGSDRHSIIVQPGAGFVWETWLTLRVGTNWEASNGAKFDLKSNTLRPAGWTSGDAAGLPMFPALPRFDECERGVVEHAMRIVVKRSRYNNYIYPATHYASAATNTSTNLPSMGQRVRLKSSFVIPAGWTKQEKAVLQALKKYGALVADNGNFFSISVTPDNRWPAGCFDHFNTIGITNFEVIQTTGPTGGPRSPGAPAAFAGADRTVPVGVPIALEGFVNFTNTFPATNLWTLYSGPTNLYVTNPALTNTTVTFNAPGLYAMMLSADDGTHAVAYDAVVFTVTQPIALTIARTGANLALTWTGGAPPYVIERADAAIPPAWSSLLTTNVLAAQVPLSGTNSFFRVRGQAF